MKKSYCVVMIVIFVVLTIFAHASNDPLGTWELVKITQKGIDYSASEENVTGWLALLSNGKLLIIVNGETGSYDWVSNSNGSIGLSDTKDLSIKLDGDQIHLSSKELELVFNKKRGGDLPETVVAYDENVFLGNWSLSRVYTDGMMLDTVFLPYTDNDIDFDIEIKKGIATFNLNNNGTKSTIPLKTIFKEGALQTEKNNGIEYKINLLNSTEIQIDINSIKFLLSKASSDISTSKCPICGVFVSGRFCSNCGTAFEKNKANNRSNLTQYNKTISNGTYKIGEDIPEGNYKITCIEVEDYLGNTLNALGGLTDLMDGDEGNALKAYYKALGGLTGDPKITIRVVDSAGYTVKSTELKKGETVSLQLKAGATLHIADGKCSLVLQH